MSIEMKMSTKIQILVLITSVITALHFSGLQGSFSHHGLHRELFFIPILLAAFWFGLKIGIWASIAISILFITGMTADSAHAMPVPVAISQVTIFIFVASILGWLSDRQRRRTEELVEAERLGTLGKTAGVISWEIKDNLNAIRSLFDKAKGLNDPQLNKDFRGELAAMDNLVESMTEYAAKESLHITTVDLNEAVKEMAQRYQSRFKEQDINLDVRNDVNGCPSQVDPAAISWVLSKLLDNALDISKPGNSVFISTNRHGNHCTVQVEDQGVGISEDQVCKIFTPFYTTKAGGSGISLAACKKTMREVGGDITARSEVGSGSTFTVIVPRQTEV